MRILVLALTIFTFFGVYAQRTEVNPEVKWKYVRSQELSFQSGRTYEYEFPAEKGYDYIFNLTHNLPKAYVSMAIFDIQYKPIDAITDSTNQETKDITFRVKDSATYKIVLVLSSGQNDAILPSTLTLIRRPITGY